MPHSASSVHFRILAYIRPARGRDPASQPKTCNLHLLSICGLPGITRSKQHIVRALGNGEVWGKGYLQAMTNYLQQSNHNEKWIGGVGEGRMDGGMEGWMEGGREGGREREGWLKRGGSNEKKVLTAGGVATSLSSLCGGGKSLRRVLHTGHGGRTPSPSKP